MSERKYRGAIMKLAAWVLWLDLDDAVRAPLVELSMAAKNEHDELLDRERAIRREAIEECIAIVERERDRYQSMPRRDGDFEPRDKSDACEDIADLLRDLLDEGER